MMSNAVISKLLISVSDYAEAIEVMRTDIDILDLKNPQEGALGALSLEDIRLIVKTNNGCKQISATIGDVPMQPHLIAERVQATLATEVDIVKIGFFGAHGHVPCIDALKGMAQGGKLIAVLFADQQPDLSLLPKLRQAGFYGVMLDTAVKDGRNLLAHMRVDHIDSLATLQADYLGFRGGVCEDFERRNKVSRTKILNLHHMLHKCNTLQVEC
jgi:uncharacterized protein (UPF0264 family)